MIERILPSRVTAAESFGDDPAAELFPQERVVVARATESRRREFATARACARVALAGLGWPAVAVLPGPGGAPQWPEGVTGSITHCAGYCAAAVGLTRDVVSLGVDAEPNEPLPDHGMLDLIALYEERVRLGQLAAAMPGICWDRLLFSAKESVYKTWFPLARSWLGFESADIVIDPHEGTFSASLLVQGPPVNGSRLTRLNGRWLADQGLLVTVAVVPARPREDALAAGGRYAPGHGPDLTGLRQMHAAEDMAGGQAELRVRERRLRASEDVRGARLAAVHAVTEPGVADVQAENCAVRPGVNPEERVSEGMRPDIHSFGTQHGNRVQLARERIVGDADPPPDCLCRVLPDIAELSRMLSYLPCRVTERHATDWISRAEVCKFLKGGQLSQLLDRDVHDMGEGEIRTPVDHWPHRHRHVFADITERMLASLTHGLYAGGFQAI